MPTTDNRKILQAGAPQRRQLQQVPEGRALLQWQAVCSGSKKLSEGVPEYTGMHAVYCWDLPICEEEAIAVVDREVLLPNVWEVNARHSNGGQGHVLWRRGRHARGPAPLNRWPG